MSENRGPRLGALVIGVSAVLAVMLFAFLTPAINSGPADLPLAVSGPTEAVAQLEAGLEKQQPGAFDTTTYADQAAVADAVRDRDAIGGISVGPGGVTLTTAAAAGTPYKAILTQIGAGLAASSQGQVAYDEVAPLTEDDPNGSAMTALGLPMIFGGMASAALLSFVYRGSPARRVAGALGIAVLGGFAVTAMLQFGYGAVDGNFWLTGLALSTAIAAIALPVLGLVQMLGPAGMGIGAVVLLFISNPLSGLATGAAWLPSPWGEIGQFLPLGAGGTVLRSTAFFDGGGSMQAWWVLAAYVVLGLVLGLFAHRRHGAHQAA